MSQRQYLDEDPPRRRATDKIPFMNGRAQQLKMLGDFVNAVAVGPLVIIAVLVVLVGWFFGYAKSPWDSKDESLARQEEHRAQTLTLNRIATLLEELKGSMDTQTKSEEKLHRWLMVVQCDKMSDKDGLRTRCVREWDR